MITVPLVGGYERMNTRINELLRNAGLEDLILNKELEYYQQDDWDFSGFDLYKNSELKRTSDYFDNIIGSKI